MTPAAGQDGQRSVASKAGRRRTQHDVQTTTRSSSLAELLEEHLFGRRFACPEANVDARRKEFGKRNEVRRIHGGDLVARPSPQSSTSGQIKGCA